MLLVKRRFELYQESSSLLSGGNFWSPRAGANADGVWLKAVCSWLSSVLIVSSIFFLEGLRRKLVFSLARVVSVSFLLNAFSFSWLTFRPYRTIELTRNP